MKLSAYAALLILCAWFGGGFYSNYAAVTKPAPDTETNAAAATPETKSETNNPAATNALTNEAAAGTNDAAMPVTNTAAAQTHAPAPTAPAAQKPAPARDESSVRRAMIRYLAALIGALIGLGLLITNDVTHYMGSQMADFQFGGAEGDERDPEYERAEAVWANGKHLEAIQMMRDFLKKNPRALFAALRIAEIYEKDLRNPLAAALEYEEVLKHKLPADRWAWAAIHLCNLYSRLNQSDKAMALLRRVADEYPRTGAAKKARERLGIAEPELEEAAQEANPEAEPESTEENQVISMEARPPELEPRRQVPQPPPEPPKPTLPPGFRPKE